jgi:hypothetical protein
MVRIAIAVALLAAACEHEPRPYKPPAPVVSSTDAMVVAAAPIDAVVPVDAAPGPGDAACDEIANHVTTVLVDKSPDPNARRTQAQRSAILKRIAVSCRTEAWSDAGIACMRAATTAAEVKKCDDIIHSRAP